MLAIHKAVFILLFAGLMFIPDVAPVLAEVRDDPLSEFIKKKIQKKKSPESARKPEPAPEPEQVSEPEPDPTPVKLSSSAPDIVTIVVVGDTGFSRNHSKVYPNSIRHLVKRGFNLMSLANNHSMDYGVAGFKETLKHIEPLLKIGLKAHAESD